MFSKTFTALMATATLIGMAHGSAMAAEEVHFSSEPVKPSALRERLAKQRGEAVPSQLGTPLVGYLSRPEGAGPFPAIVVLHGCGGLGPRLKHDVAGRLVSQGYVVLAVDSFASREMKSTCQNTRSDNLFTITHRVYDAYGALNYLSKYPYVAADRVALIGFSAGGVTALEATKVYGIEQLMTRKFKAAVAYYPTCSPNDGDATVPTLIMVGELDDWGPPALCRQRLENLSGSGPEIRLNVYPGAAHDFDVPTAKTGTVYFGDKLEYDAAATAQSNRDVSVFLRNEMGN